MAGKVLDLDGILEPDSLAYELANTYVDWEVRRASWVKSKEEIQRYLFATDTTSTSNSKLPWKNKTTTPKLTQIRDNLFANYMAAVFPKRKWLYWEAHDKKSGQKEKKEAARNYIAHCIDQPQFKSVIRRMALDFIDYGNIFGCVEWIDNRQTLPDGTKAGFTGPMPRRLSPMDIVFNPVAENFEDAPKIIRSLITIGELAKMIDGYSSPDIDAKKVFDYVINLRNQVSQHVGSFHTKNTFLNIAGFSDYLGYLNSNYVEMLTCYGDYYDVHNKKFYQNAVVTIVDRHKIISIKTDESKLGGTQIFHTGWRIRQDSPWAMGPLDNLVGLQYRVDHLENLKADAFDLMVAPVTKVKGLVEDFKWEPFGRIYVGDDGDVEVFPPNAEVLKANLEIQYLMSLMEEMAGSPKEAAGFRTPGEKTAYEVQRLENAANRIFFNKIIQFEEFIEKLLNAMLEEARRKIDSQTLIRILDDELSVESFMTIMPEDLISSGRIKPIAARNFAERTERVQNLTNFYASAVGADPSVQAHFSSIKVAKMIEDLLDLQDYELVVPFIRLSEQAEAQKLSNASEEQTMMAAQQPAGMTPDDLGE